MLSVRLRVPRTISKRLKIVQAATYTEHGHALEATGRHQTLTELTEQTASHALPKVHALTRNVRLKQRTREGSSVNARF